MCLALMISLCRLLICFVVFVAAVPTKDVMLGTVKIPLADLVHKRTGELSNCWVKYIF